MISQYQLTRVCAYFIDQLNPWSFIPRTAVNVLSEHKHYDY